MKVGIITFHASHNYGSMLQAYALQQTVISLGHDCDIINFRTQRQRQGYLPFYCGRRLRGKIKALLFPRMAWERRNKYRMFESFLRDNYTLSQSEYHTNADLCNAEMDYDVYISGSDQIWNTSCFDFDWAYYLNFVKRGKKIAYAPSMGPKATLEIASSMFGKIKQYAESYDSVSVREQGTAELFQQITGKEVPITLDPTLLLPFEQWSELAGDTPVIEGDYILLYIPWYDKRLYAKAEEIAAEFGVKVVCTLGDYAQQYRNNPNFMFYTAVGPLQFLNIAKFSRFIVCASFHAVVFSIVFKKPFYAYNGMEDNRIQQLLRLTALEKYCKSPERNILNEPSQDFDIAQSKLETARSKSMDFLRESIDL